MTLAMWGAVLGALAAGGLLLVVVRVAAIRRPQLALRVTPYVRDLPQVGRTPALKVASASPTVAAARDLRAVPARGAPTVSSGCWAVRRPYAAASSAPDSTSPCTSSAWSR